MRPPLHFHCRPPPPPEMLPAVIVRCPTRPTPPSRTRALPPTPHLSCLSPLPFTSAPPDRPQLLPVPLLPRQHRVSGHLHLHGSRHRLPQLTRAGAAGLGLAGRGRRRTQRRQHTRRGAGRRAAAVSAACHVADGTRRVCAGAAQLAGVLQQRRGRTQPVPGGAGAARRRCADVGRVAVQGGGLGTGLGFVAFEAGDIVAAKGAGLAVSEGVRGHWALETSATGARRASRMDRGTQPWPDAGGGGRAAHTRIRALAGMPAHQRHL